MVVQCAVAGMTGGTTMVACTQIKGKAVAWEAWGKGVGAVVKFPHPMQTEQDTDAKGTRTDGTEID